VQISNGFPRFHTTTLEAGKNTCYIMLQASKNTCCMLEASENVCNVTDKWILKEIYTWSPALGPSVLKRIGLQRLSSFIKLEFWK